MVSDRVSTHYDLSRLRVWVSWNSSLKVDGLLITFSYISKNFHVIIYIIFNTKIEKLNEKKTIFTILNHVLLMVVEPPMCREPLRADPLLVRAFTCFALNAGES